MAHPSTRRTTIKLHSHYFTHSKLNDNLNKECTGSCVVRHGGIVVRVGWKDVDMVICQSNVVLFLPCVVTFSDSDDAMRLFC